HIVSLIKPQFEAGKDQVGKGGVVRDSAIHQEVIEKVKKFGTEELGFQWLELCTSPITGPAGNVEFLAYWQV
ncbi:MAG: TlyA family rRNA (cytidine-2'-O)-methyltransferase, partial [Verrucomicrobia bacterium]|nr:TlyA family rRNA (cytidine-2'-O)-methyltransferase [Verrucomicrobiota bacterium]